MSDRNISFKSFFETIDRKLHASSREELCSIILGMAQEITPEERGNFLKMLRPIKKEEIESLLKQEDLISDIDDFSRTYRGRMKKADEMDEYPVDYYDDEDSLGPYTEFVTRLKILLDRTKGVFEAKNYALAVQAYQKLFVILELEDNYGRGIRLSDIGNSQENSEDVSRYFRALYEMETPASRPASIFAHMMNLKNMSVVSRLIKLEDIMQMSTDVLPEEKSFLQSWKNFLMSRKEKEADVLLREATSLLEGSDGLAALAREEGGKRPYVYLDWVDALLSEQQYPGIITAANEALKKLPVGMTIRSKIADRMYVAAKKLRDTPMMLQSRWEAFVPEPTLRRLLDLHEATDENGRLKWMKKAEAYLTEWFDKDKGNQSEDDGDFYEERACWISQDVLVYGHLLVGNWKAAKELADTSEIKEIVVPAFLALIAGKVAQLPPKAKFLWQETLEKSAGDVFFSTRDEPDVLTSKDYLEKACHEAIERSPLSQVDADAITNWCLNIMKQRLDSIVGNKDRRSYDKAALLLAACAEILRFRGQDRAADSLISETRNKFSSYPAFQRALKSV